MIVEKENVKINRRSAFLDAWLLSKDNIIRVSLAILALWGIVDGFYSGNKLYTAAGVWFSIVFVIDLIIYVVKKTIQIKRSLFTEVIFRKTWMFYSLNFHRKKQKKLFL